MKKINTVTYLHFSKILIMKHDFTHCGPSNDSRVMMVYPNVSSTLSREHCNVSCSGMSHKFWISNNFIAYRFKLISGIRDNSSQKFRDSFPIRIFIHFRYFIHILAKFDTFSRCSKVISTIQHFQYRVGTSPVATGGDLVGLPPKQSSKLKYETL